VTTIKLKERELRYLLHEELSKMSQEIRFVSDVLNPGKAFDLKHLRRIHYNTTGDHYSSSVLTIMLPTYRTCALEHGTRIQSRIHTIMEARLRQGDIFRIIGNSVRNSTHGALDETYDNINNYVIEMYANIERQIKISRGAEAGKVSRSHPRELKRVRTTLAEARGLILKLQRQTTPAREEARRLGWVR